jgi:hypothetical protein
MNEVNLFKNNEDLLSYFEGVTLRFNFLSDGMAHYKTTIPKLIDGNFIDVTASFYYDDGSSLLDYSTFEDMSHFNQLSEIYYFNTNQDKIVLYFAKYKEVSIP